VVLASVRPVGLGQRDPHQVVRLGIFRRDANGVAGMQLGRTRRPC
jgi:hypothetical protein